MGTESGTTELAAFTGVPKTAMQVLEVAVASGDVDVSVIERLVALQERQDERSAQAALNDALHRFQEICPPVIKGRPVYGKDRSRGPQYHFASFGDVHKTIRNPLRQCGLSFSHTISDDGKMVVCVVKHVDGATVESKFPLMTDSGPPNANKAQAIGSGLSYAKRYSLEAALGLSRFDRDDDAGTLTPVTVNDLKDIAGQFSKRGFGNVKTEMLPWLRKNVFGHADMTDKQLRDPSQWSQADLSHTRELMQRVNISDLGSGNDGGPPAEEVQTVKGQTELAEPEMIGGALVPESGGLSGSASTERMPNKAYFVEHLPLCKTVTECEVLLKIAKESRAEKHINAATHKEVIEAIEIRKGQVG